MEIENAELDSIAKALCVSNERFRLSCRKCDNTARTKFKGKYLDIINYREAAKTFYNLGWRFQMVIYCPRCVAKYGKAN